MYQLEAVKMTKLAKKLGGPPVFHEGTLEKISLSEPVAVLTMKILSRNNPSLEKDTVVHLTLRGVKAYALSASTVGNGLTTIHDLQVRREEAGLHLRIESARGEISSIRFEKIELTDSGT